MSAARLCELQRRSGLNSEHFFLSAKGLRSKPFEHPLNLVSAAIDNFVVKRKGFESSHVSLLRNRLSSSLALERVEAADVVHLHWPIGMLGNSFGKRVSMGKKIVLTLHDDFLFTGFCHSAGNCFGYEGGCTRCPLVSPLLQPFVASASASLRHGYQPLNHLEVIGQSQWMLNRARGSMALKGASMRLIPNVIPGDFITSPLVSKPENTLGLIASDLSDPNKGVGKVLALAERYPGITFELIGPASMPIEAPHNVRLLGRLPSSEIARRASYWRAGLVVSRHENAPAVISELACLGVPTVSIPSGAIREMSGMYGFDALVSSGDTIGSLEDALSRLQPFTLFKTRSEIASRARAIHAEDRLLNDHLDAYGLL